MSLPSMARLGMGLFLLGAACIAGWSFSDSTENDAGVLIVLLAWPVALFGLYLLVRSLRAQRREESAAFWRTWSFTRPGPQPRNLAPTFLESPSAPAATKTPLLPAGSLIGVIVIVASVALAAFVQHWTATRTIRPLDTPLRLTA